jgi:hypothetical protein
MSVNSSNLRPALLGYDARTISVAWMSLWTDEIRRRFLIKSDVEMPLSVDTLIWPSVFDWGEGAGMPDSERRRLLLTGGLPATGAEHNWWKLWSDQSRMDTALTDLLDEAFRPFWRIAVGIADCDAPRRAVDLEFLGYDVADGGMISGLTNCAYDDDEIAAYSAWSSELNVFHLFDDWKAADRFRCAADSRVPEHSPFSVYALWRASSGQ